MTCRVKSLNKRQVAYFFIFSIFLSILFTGCGLEEYAYLYPPDAWNDGTTFYFKNNTKNDSSIFMGFHILYKFYASEEAITTAISSVENYYENYPTSIYSKMTNSLGYKDLMIGSSESLTIATDNRNDSFTILIDFTSVLQGGTNVPITVYSGTVSTTPSLSSTNVYRSVENNDVGFSQEELDESKAYKDLISGTNFDSSSGKTYLMLYVLAYGYDTSTWTAIYSEPQYFTGNVKYVDGFTVED